MSEHSDEFTHQFSSWTRAFYLRQWLAGLLVSWIVLPAQTHCAEWHQAPGYRWRELQVPDSGKVGFTRLEEKATGIHFTNLLADDRSIRNRNLLSGSGVALGDVDGDGWCDLYLCGLDGSNALFRNLGQWKFEDITAGSGVACAGQDSTGATFADIDGDGDLDLLVNALGGGTRLFLNDGKGKFSEATEEAGLRSRTGSMSLALADVDLDGDLDLYIANFRPTTILDNPQTKVTLQIVDGRHVVAMVSGRPATAPDLTNRFAVSPSGEVLEYGEPDVLYLNDGKGRFSPRSWTGGDFLDEDGNSLREAPNDWSLAVHMRDFTGDGAPDIYICSDLFTPDRIWVNDGKGRFRALDNFSLRNTSTFSMGVDFADIDRDGHLDMFVVDMLSREHSKRQVQLGNTKPIHWPIGIIDVRPQLLRNTLQWNRGDGTYAEIALYAGVEASEWSWGPLFLDVDLDGYEDILVTNGQKRDFQNIDLTLQMEADSRRRRFSQADILNWVKQFPRLYTANVAFRNRGDLTFEEMGGSWGFDSSGISQAMAMADLDNDGDLDVVVNNLDGGAGIYRNDSVAARVAVRLKGLPPNTQGTGALIKVLGGAVPQQQQEIICGGRYLSGDEAIRVFAAGGSMNPVRIEVSWLSGRRSVIENARPNRLYEVDEAQSQPDSPRKPQGKTDLWFEDVSHLLNHSHVEEAFDDFARQPLLPNRLSQLGPGISWHDFDGDGWDDLVIGSGRGGHMHLFRNTGAGEFAAVNELPVNRPVARDQTTILRLDSFFFAGSANYEDGQTNGGAMRVYSMEQKVTGEGILGELSSRGPMAMADVNGDGSLHLFIGGRVIPGRYPEPADSLLLRIDSGRFTPVQRFEKLGLVSGAVFSDLDADGTPELVLACEWGPVRVFRKEGKTYVERTEELGLANYTGWWNGVTTGDLDGDGRLDIIATNWGLNSKYRASRDHPRRLYHGDLNGDGIIDIIEAGYDETMKCEVPERNLRAIGSALPFIHETIQSFEAYGASGLHDIFGKSLEKLDRLSANTLESMVFFNRGSQFEAVPLPREAQFTPAFGVCVGDMDGDGNEDLFLSQNFFATTPETARNDAGRGLWLRGDGGGGLRPVPGQESGIKVYGEQRGCALADFDLDGRVDLAVSQNGNQTKLYRNIGAKPGLRVRLHGEPNNPYGIGAAMRLFFGDRGGPVREIHAGSGYWSQDSMVQVLGIPEEPTHIEVRWPGGNVTKTALPRGAREVKVTYDGKAMALR